MQSKNDLLTALDHKIKKEIDQKFSSQDGWYRGGFVSVVNNRLILRLIKKAPAVNAIEIKEEFDITANPGQVSAIIDSFF